MKYLGLFGHSPDGTDLNVREKQKVPEGQVPDCVKDCRKELVSSTASGDA